MKKYFFTPTAVLAVASFIAPRKRQDEDVKAIFCYLKSIKPVKNRVPDHITPDKQATYIH